MQCHVFWNATRKIAVTDKQDGEGLPEDLGPWRHVKSIEVKATDGPRIGASSAEILQDINDNGFHMWPGEK